MAWEPQKWRPILGGWCEARRGLCGGFWEGLGEGAGLAGEGSAGGASGRPVSGVDGAVRGFASFGGGAAPWPSGGEESRAQLLCARSAGGLAGGVMAPREVRGGSQRRWACRAGAGGGGDGAMGPCELL